MTPLQKKVLQFVSQFKNGPQKAASEVEITLFLNGEKSAIATALGALVADHRIFKIDVNGVKRYATKNYKGYKAKKQSAADVDENITTVVAEEEADDEE